VIRQNSGVQYLPGDQVAVADASGNKTYYVRNNSGGWDVDNTPHTAVLLDGWGNPIIYVPGPAEVAADAAASAIQDAYGLQGVSLEALRGGLTRVVNPRSIPWGNNARANYQNLKAYQPFWVSAGPDGSFVKGDDNVYSFDQQ
jgi:hypothetical protein